MQLGIVAHDLHGASAQHIGGADDHGKADLLGDALCFGARCCDAVLRLAQLELAHQPCKAVTVLGEVDGIGRGAKDRNAGLLQRIGELQRCLAAELHDDAVQRSLFLLGGDDFQHVLGGQRLEVEAVRGVIVGRDRFRIAVDHDRLVAGIMQCKAGMAAAVVELDALADAVRPATQDDDLLLLRHLGFVAV